MSKTYGGRPRFQNLPLVDRFWNPGVDRMRRGKRAGPRWNLQSETQW